MVGRSRWGSELAAVVLITASSLFFVLDTTTAVATPVGTITEFSIGLNVGSEPLDITSGPDGNMWFTDLSGAIGRVTPGGTITEFNGPGAFLCCGIVSGPDGNLWFTERSADAIGRIAPDGTITQFSVGLAEGECFMLCPLGDAVAGSDGNIWFSEKKAIGRITPAGTITQFSAGLSPVSSAEDLVLGPDGDLWFVEQHTGGIWRISTTGTITEFSVGLNAGSRPSMVVPGPDGNLWFTDIGTTKAIGRITPSGAIIEFSSGLSPGSGLYDIVAGPDGNLWFNDAGTKAIGRITPSGAITEFSAGLSPEGAPSSLVPGPDGNVWFLDGRAIGSITPAGAITEFSAGLNPNSSLESLAPGGGGALWFTDEANYRYHGTPAIGRITAVEPPLPQPEPEPEPEPERSSLTGSVSLVSADIKTRRNGESAIKLICAGTGTCRGRLTLVFRAKRDGKKARPKSKIIGTTTFAIPHGATETIMLRLNSVGRSLLRVDHGRLGARLTIVKSSPSPAHTYTGTVHLVLQNVKAK